jgi:hypothetical protein
VSSASKADEGSYICRAKNEAGEREEMIQVRKRMKEEIERYLI